MNKIIAVILLLAFVLSGIGYAGSKLKLNGVSKAIKGNESIILDLWLDEVPSTNANLFQSGQYTNLMVRNRPHGKLQIVSSRCVPLSADRFYLRRVSIPTNTVPPQEEAFQEPFLWQCRLTLLDQEALSTNNGYISHGNQLKIGTRISLEAALYRVDGFIVNITSKKL